MSSSLVQKISFVLARLCDANTSYVYSKEKHYSVANDKSGSKYVLKFRSGNDLLFWHALVPQTVDVNFNIKTFTCVHRVCACAHIKARSVEALCGVLQLADNVGMKCDYMWSGQASPAKLIKAQVHLNAAQPRLVQGRRAEQFPSTSSGKT